MAVWTPPVNLPDLGGSDYGAQLYAMAAGPGEVLRQQRRDRIEDLQFSQAAQLKKELADRDYALELQKLEAGVGANEEKWYGSPQWYDMGGGKMGFGVLSDRGNFKEMTPPEGGAWAPPVVNLNTGTSYVPVSSRGGSRVNQPETPIDVTGAAAAREAGGVAGAAQGILPGAKVNADFISGQITEMLNNPGLALITGGGGAGGFGGVLPTWGSFSATTRDQAREAQNKLDYIKAQVFPLAYDLIRGAGPIAIYESQAAGKALARLEDQALSDTDYKEALTDFDAKIKLLIKALEAKAGSPGTAPAADAPEEGGEVITEPGATLPVRRIR